MRTSLDPSNGLWPLIVFCLWLVTTPSSAYSKMTGQLNLMATIDGEPAFREVNWQLKPINDKGKPEVKVNRHSAVIDLEAGKYEVTATLGAKTKTQIIQIQEGGKHKLILNLN